MDQFPRISVIVPTIGRDTLKRTLNSIFESKYPNLEILVSANSVEESEIRKILSNYSDNVKFTHCTNEKLYPSKVKNIALRFATGEYITFLDDDDSCYPPKFFDLVEALEQDDSYIASFGQYDTRDCHTNKIKKYCSGGHDNVCFDTLLENNYIGSGSIMYRNCDEIRFDETIEFGEDWMLNLKLLGTEHKITFIKTSTYVWTHNELNGYTATFRQNNVDWHKIVRDNQRKALELWKKN